MKHFIHFLLVSLTLCCFNVAKAQKIDSIYVNLYTDSLKKGTLNYINIDGKLKDGRYLPLDSTDLIFSSSAGMFKGNCLWIEGDFKDDKVTVKVVVRNNPALFKQFEMYIKKKPDNERLRTTEEILKETGNSRKTKRKGN